MLPNVLKDVDEQTICDLDERRSRRTDLRKSAWKTCGEAGCPTEQDVAQLVPGSVERGRADRIGTAEEREDWIFVLDLAESMAETLMTQRRKIKTVHMCRASDACSLAGSVHSCQHGMYKSCFAGDGASRL